MELFAAIDPGKNGAIVVVDTNSDFAMFETLKYNEENILLTKIDNKYGAIEQFFVEKIHGRGGFSAGSNFQMGSMFGQVCHSLHDKQKSITWVLPRVWQKRAHEHATIESKIAKEKSLSAYYAMFPSGPIEQKLGRFHDGICDALLIAAYAQKEYFEKEVPNWKFNKTELLIG